MKKIIFLSFIIFANVMYAQTQTYSQMWKEIEAAEKTGNVKSLLPKVNAVYERAAKEGQSAEIVKSLLYRAQIVAQTQEDGEGDLYKSAILDFEREIPKFGSGAERATQAVLQSLLANIYYAYMQNTQWKRRSITELDSLPADLAEWSSNQILIKSLELYSESIGYMDILKNEKTADWKAVLTSAEDIDLYPTLFDVLAMRFVNRITGDSFSSLDILKEEKYKSENLKEAAFDILRQLSAFHQNDTDKSAFLNYKLKEIENGLNVPVDLPAGATDTVNTLQNSILQLAEANKTERFSAYLYYRAAQIFSENGDRRRAHAICRSVKYDPKNKWTENAKSLLADLERKRADLTIDRNNLPGEPIAVTLSATNMDEVHYRIFKLRQYIDKDGDIEKDRSLYKSGVWTLKHFDDYAEHSTVVKLDELPQGYYFIEINIPDEKIYSSNAYFYVDEWLAVQLQHADFQLLNRRTGEVLADKTLTLYSDSTKNISLKTDSHGIFSVPRNERNYDSYYLYNPEAKTYTELPKIYFYGNDENENETEYLWVDFFLDRAIYRPGQTVYFKGIVYSTNKNNAKILKKHKVKIELENTNNETVAELTLTTNDYGAVFGEFILPQNGLSGTYELTEEDLDGSISFLVEEYKRPRFKVEIDALQGEFVLEQEVKVTGRAESFAGAAVGGAKVAYRVERQEIFPYFRWWFPPQPVENETIVQGETTTDDSGKFEIAFTAKPKNAKKAGEYRTYTYSVTADVTDINGETHTAQQSVTIGDLPRMLSLNFPEKSLQKNFTKIGIQSKNLNGATEHSQGQITVTRLIAPDRIILPNKIGWQPSFRSYYNPQKTGYQLYGKEEFVKLFPHLPYTEDEMRPQTWQRGQVLNYNFNTETSGNVEISRLQKGFYMIEAISLYGKDTIRTERMIEILDDKTLTATDNNFFSTQLDKQSYQVGDRITVSFLSDWKNAIAIVHLESGKKWIEHREIPIRNGKGVLTLTVTPEFLKNGLCVNSLLLHQNGYAQKNFEVNITEKPRDLEITTKTFRDKIKPGQPETWELTVSGEDKDRFTAEVLATMYDASLDEFEANLFYFSPFGYSPSGYLYNMIYLPYGSNYTSVSSRYGSKFVYPQFPNLKDYNAYGGYREVAAMRSMSVANNSVAVSADAIVLEESVAMDMAAPQALQGKIAGVATGAAEEGADTGGSAGAKADVKPAAQIRTNLQETAFFYPNLYTDSLGNVKFSFTSPEALTEWKLLVLAHTQDLQSGTAEFYTKTQKELMITPNLPRFVREGDEVVVSVKIDNLSGENLTGNVNLHITDALTGLPLPQFLNDADFMNEFSAEKGKSAEASFRFNIPQSVQAIQYRIVAATEDERFSDGEQGIIPVLPNRMLVTETMPIFAKEGQTRTFTMEKLANNPSATLTNFNLSLELTTNPLWIAVMSLPYLREYPYECSEQLFSRLYGNIISAHIVNSNPKIKAVFDNWNAAGHNVSALEQNEELKNILLEETPWVREAQSETEQRKRLALFFDLNRMSQELAAAQQKLSARQNADGGFPWFEGGKSSPYITAHIVQGFGQLLKMLGEKGGFSNSINSLIPKAVQYIDREQVKAIKEAEKNVRKNGGKVDGRAFIHYYYVRSFWKDEYPLPAEAKKYLDDINSEIQKYFESYDLQRKAMIATTLHRYGYTASARAIINNIKETSVETDEMGMYWKDNRAGWLWFQSPVEAQAKAIEAFDEINKHSSGMEWVNYIEEMKIWLLKNRQTNSWNSTKATTDAVYALMTFGKDLTNAEEGINVWIGNNPITAVAADSPQEAAAGYAKYSWKGTEITPEMATVKAEKITAGAMWGGLYWQYFENLDKITQANSNVRMEKQLFRKINSDEGQKLLPAENFKVGDLITVRLVIHIDREMEYIHIKDMRAAGFEPVNVLSRYKYQNGCAYYESTRDAATNFFFERMTKGTYVFEYDLRANNAGVFSNGITTLQNMYAPEMSCHSSGLTVEIEG